MERTVRFVFMSLFGTVVAMALGVFAIEYVNLSITSYAVRNAIETSLYNACNSFNQESYRSTALSELQGVGGTYQSGNVYGLTNGEDVYEKFYGTASRTGYNDYGTARWVGSTNDEYKTYLNSSIATLYSGGEQTVSIGQSYEELGYIADACDWLDHPYEVELGTPQYSSIMTGLREMNSEYTPMNTNGVYVGICDGGANRPAYNAVTNLFKWNLASIWSNCSADARYCASYDDDGNQIDGKYALRNGWRIYTDTAEITDIEYYIYDISSTDGKEELKRVTNIEDYNIGRHANSSRSNEYVMAARLKYDVEVEYVGITPMARVINYIMGIGDQERGTVHRDYTIGGGESGIDITRDTGEAQGGFMTHIKSDGANGEDYYVWYYNIT